jgi:hypothetical protein
MTTPKTAIINLLTDFGPLTSVQISDALEDCGVGSTLRDLLAEGSIRRNVHGAWELDGAADVDPEFDEPSDGFLSDAEADADVLASAGMGTDEDYGYAEDVL